MLEGFSICDGSDRFRARATVLSVGLRFLSVFSFSMPHKDQEDSWSQNPTVQIYSNFFKRKR